MSLTFDAFRHLLLAAVVAGAIAGGVLFVIQYVAVSPLIEQAEAYERASPEPHGQHGSSEWEPADGFERTVYTAIGTVLTGIAFAAIAFGLVSVFGVPMNLRSGLVLGLVGFVSFVVAPSVGLPPKPPGVAAAEVPAAQAWWVLAAACSALGCGLILRSGATRIAIAIGIFALALPHLVGSPAAAPSGQVPPELATRFAWVSVATRLPFWLLLGAIGGHLLRPVASAPASRD